MGKVKYSTKAEISKAYNRTGKCKQCGECCKVYVCSGNITKEKMKYLIGFGYKRVKKEGVVIAILEKECKYLKDGKCSIWNTKKFSTACRQFPCPDDGVYLYCKDKCGFKFGE